MSDLTQLRDLTAQIRPPSFDCLVTTARRRSRRTTTFTIACATVIVLVGAGVMNADANDRSVAPVSPPDNTSQVVTLPPGQKWATVEKGRYAVQLAPSLTYEVDVPDRWRVYEGRFFNTPPSGANSIFFVSVAPADSTQLPQHPCDDPTGTRVGSSVSDLAHALRRQPVLEVSRPDPVTVNGNDGLYVEVRIPETVDSTTCIDDNVALFSTRWDNWGWTEGFVGQWWILNVDGERVVVNGQCDTACADDDFDTLTTMAESITFPRPG